jgi:hypothetical protein
MLTILLRVKNLMFGKPEKVVVKALVAVAIMVEDVKKSSYL